MPVPQDRQDDFSDALEEITESLGVVKRLVNGSDAQVDMIRLRLLPDVERLKQLVDPA